MPTTTLLPTRLRRRSAARADVLYGYDYNPSWPSVLSVAHDTLAGENLYVITDRPCALLGIDLPLVVRGAGGEALAIVAAAMVLSTKFQVTLSDAMPAGAAWQWGGGAGGDSQLIDAVTGHAPNAGHGTCADVPGPYVPPPPPAPPVLLSARFDSMLLRLTLGFDRNVDASAADVAAFVVHDGRDTGQSYQGTGPVGLVSGSAIEILLTSTGAYEGLGTTLVVGAENGVASAIDDAPWAGVAGDALPWPVYPPANVVAASCDESTATLWFDAPVWLNGTGGGGPTPDDAVKFDGIVPSSVIQVGDTALQFTVGGVLGPGSSWVIERQPNWVGADVAAPQEGTFA